MHLFKQPKFLLSEKRKIYDKIFRPITQASLINNIMKAQIIPPEVAVFFS